MVFQNVDEQPLQGHAPTREYYKLDVNLLEKEKTVYEQIVGEVLRYDDDLSLRTHPDLSEKAQQLGILVFLPYSTLKKLPTKPGDDVVVDDKNPNLRQGFHIQTDKVLAFRGLGGKDLAKIWHMLIIPTANLAARNYVEGSPEIFLRWVFDLKPEHAPVLKEMISQATEYFLLNRDFFLEKFGGEDAMIGDRPLKFWLQPENFQFGFHVIPSIGYIHMHALIGPLTEFGAQDMYLSRWMCARKVLSNLESGRSMSELLPKE